MAQFNRALRNLDACVLHDQQRKGNSIFQNSICPILFLKPKPIFGVHFFSNYVSNVLLCLGLSGAAQRSAYPQAFIMVTIDCGALAAMFNPYAGSSNSSVGLTAEEILELAYIAGAHPNV